MNHLHDSFVVMALVVCGAGCFRDTANNRPTTPPPYEASENEIDAAPVPPSTDLTPVPLLNGVAKLTADNTKVQFLGYRKPTNEEARLGVFTKFTGTAEVDRSTLTVTRLTVRIDSESLISSNRLLTHHLLSADVLSVRDFPLAEFKSTRIFAKSIDGEYTIEGQLTLRDITLDVNFPAFVAIYDEGLILRGELAIEQSAFDLSFDQVDDQVMLAIVIGEASRLHSDTEEVVDDSASSMAEERFAQCDSNGNKVLEGDEIPSWVAANLSSFDTNQNGAVELGEFQQRVGAFNRRDKSIEEPVDIDYDFSPIFTQLDADGDGRLTDGELPEWLRQMMATLDTNDDGALSLQEAEQGT